MESENAKPLTESRIKSFVKRFLNKLDKDKPFHISLNGEKIYINRETVDEFNQHKPKEGGFLPFLAPLLSGLFTSGSGYSLNDHEGGFLGAIMSGLSRVVPFILKGIKNLVPVAQLAGGISETVRNSKQAAGHGIFLNPFKGKALKEILIPIVDRIGDVEDEGKTKIRKSIHGLKPFFKIYEEKDGKGIYLKPY